MRASVNLMVEGWATSVEAGLLGNQGVRHDSADDLCFSSILLETWPVALIHNQRSSGSVGGTNRDNDSRPFEAALNCSGMGKFFHIQSDGELGL